MQVIQSKKLSERWLLTANLFANTGNAMIWPVTTLHMTVSLGQDLTMSGVVILFSSLMNILGAYIAGKLFDRWRPYPTLIGASLIAFFSLVTLFFYNGWPVFAFLMMTASFGIGSVNTLLNAYATTVTGKNTRIIFNNMYIVLNVGVVIGTLAVGYLFDYGFQWLMLLAATLFLILTGIAVSIFNVNTDIAPVMDDDQAEEISHEDHAEPILTRDQEAVKEPAKFEMSPLLWFLAAFLFVIYLSYMLWETVMAPHLRSIGISTRHYADLWVLNGLTIILFQKIISTWANKHPYRLSVITGGFVFASSFILMLFVDQFWQIVLVFELLTLGEMLASPQVPAWVAQLTPKEVSGQAQGFVSIMISLGRMVGPLYGGIMLDHGWFNPLFFSVFIAMIVANVGLLIVARKKKE
ncbi:MFS transporter [Fructobacillus tropaeoli]|uniref:MFS family (AraJ) n=1 Tax=Fructobacillus tropaeoli TaxID=709323 RepID=A0A3F3H118_9LACO|nr:MFS transporter [Fructobacillus tropaeoli]GAP04771.1 major facilitator superfamily permease [Fructobacillus tropaeoli]CAK1248999.1 MFS family (AraJ) [Fructobacillus tropaeoli]CAK1253056.1 MFS family (AraJ) [Fructobacillus tropaeoli]CAK1253129.1 MFS family (AraJ) [Fructobacillus tropaeoli]